MQQISEETMNLSQLPSSPGDSPVFQTPKDVDPNDAAARDVTERNVNSDNPAERQEALLDEANELTFPASDPIAVPSLNKLIEESHRAWHALCVPSTAANP